MRHALGHAGPKSLLARLKKEGLAHALSFGVGPALEHSCCLALSLDLTEAGEAARYGRVLELAFEAVGALGRDTRVDPRVARRRWDELVVIDAATFDFSLTKSSAYSRRADTSPI